MLKLQQRFVLQAFLTSLIGFVSYTGDVGLQNGKTEIVRALSDNLTHATVGGITWALVIIISKKSAFEYLRSIIICFLMSSLIDVDHFIAAESMDINDATHLKYRPFLHCTTIPIVLWAVMNVIAKLTSSTNLIICSWMIFGSFLSHHIRDGNRRGLWFWPFGSTRPIPYYMYISVSMALPYCMQWIMDWQLSKDTKYSEFIV
ncbi:transmembrane protein 267 [Copidosoma floridanum]|uniref:transmembrane protein 267 n=1 Tax=Copidosoma floridanum TaxID=29053 RepID=UPI0006C9DD16|nr:transmembrane protein 267 [Copidosoma floridanum]